MPSFDVVSEVDQHELTNAVDQANRTVTNRFDFKGVDAGFAREGYSVKLHAEADIQIRQMEDLLRQALIKCKIDPKAMEIGEVEQSGKQYKQSIDLKNGLETEMAKKIVKLIKAEKKLKVQAQIQADQVRVTGKKRDDLQATMALLKAAELDVALQFNNFRD